MIWHDESQDLIHKDTTRYPWATDDAKQATFVYSFLCILFFILERYNAWNHILHFVNIVVHDGAYSRKTIINLKYKFNLQSSVMKL